MMIEGVNFLFEKYSKQENVEQVPTTESFNTHENVFIAHASHLHIFIEKFTFKTPNHHKIESNIHKNTTSVETFSSHFSLLVSFGSKFDVFSCKKN